MAVPSVASVTPNSGPTTGGTEVVIVGANFVDIIDVLTDGVFGIDHIITSVDSFTVDSDTQITAVMPASPAGTCHVDVYNADGHSL